jgi:hypothetical protein
LSAAVLATAAALGWSCGPVASDGVGDVDAGPDDGPADAGLEDLSRSPDCPTTSPWITDVSGRIVDEDGAGIADAFAQMCVRTNLGRLLCLRPTTSGDDGAFTADVAANARCMERATARVVKPQTDTATLYCAVPLTTDVSSVVLAEPHILLATTPATTLPPEGDGVAVQTVTFADGVVVDVAPAALPDGTWERLAARVLDVADAPACLRADAPPLTTLVAFSPELDVDGNGATVRLPNRGGLAAGATVPVHALGSIDCRRSDGELLEEGRWEVIGDGVVSADGASIDVENVPCLTWLGVGLP